MKYPSFSLEQRIAWRDLAYETRRAIGKPYADEEEFRRDWAAWVEKVRQKRIHLVVRPNPAESTDNATG